jgi:hypothetical protein
VAKRMASEPAALFSTFAGPVVAMLLLSCRSHALRVGALKALAAQVPPEFLSSASAEAAMDIVGGRRRVGVAVVLQLLGAARVGDVRVDDVVAAAAGGWISQVR